MLNIGRKNMRENNNQSQIAMEREFPADIMLVKLSKIGSLRAKHTIIMSHMATGKRKQVAAAIVTA